MSTSGAHRRPSRIALVLLQILVFVTYIFGPTASLAEEPTAGSDRRRIDGTRAAGRAQRRTDA